MFSTCWRGLTLRSKIDLLSMNRRFISCLNSIFIFQNLLNFRPLFLLRKWNIINFGNSLHLLVYHLFFVGFILKIDQLRGRRLFLWSVFFRRWTIHRSFRSIIMNLGRTKFVKQHFFFLSLRSKHLLITVTLKCLRHSQVTSVFNLQRKIYAFFVVINSNFFFLLLIIVGLSEARRRVFTF